MQNQTLDQLRYPIGNFAYGSIFTPGQTQEHIASIAVIPHNLTQLVGKWGDDRLDTPYRPGGWTVRQVVHHVVDSHVNAYVRTKLLLTENNPTIKPYDQDAWASLPDYQLDAAPSLVILSNLHQRWVTVLEAVNQADFDRTYYHPEQQRTVPLSEVVGMYAWHGEHHYGQIYRLAGRNGWLEKNV